MFITLTRDWPLKELIKAMIDEDFKFSYEQFESDNFLKVYINESVNKVTKIKNV